MNIRKTFASFLSAVVALTGFTAGTLADPGVFRIFAESGESGENTDYRYFYRQLTPESKVFYDALYEMYSTGLFKSGKGELELTGAGYISDEEAADYAEGGGRVLNIFGAARDAFTMDYPDIFYVDFSAVSVRVTSSGAGRYHIYIGTGRRDDYYAEGIENEEQVEKALAEQEKVVGEIVSQAEKLEPEEGKDLTAEQIRYVHDYVINNTSYRLEDVCAPDNIGFIRTSYGSLVRGEAVCEGYSRAFKAVLDRLDIPCVLVSGVYRHTADSVELHMWTEVQLGDVWYGVDATMDDPKSSEPSDNGVDGYENDMLLLAGDIEMDKHHAASSILSEAGYEFEYPGLSYDNYGEATIKYDNGLVVTYDPDGTFEGEPAGIFHVSYKGMGAAKSQEQGKYFLCNTSNYYENTGEWDTTGWIYMTPELYPALQDSDTELVIPMPHIQYAQFGITDLAYGEIDYNGNTIPELFYQGDPSLLEAESETYHNPNGYYIAPPGVEKCSPRNGGKITAGKEYNVSVTYTDTLVPVEGEDIGMTFTCSGASGVEYSSLSNLEWDGDRTVTFDFTASDMWADENATYNFSLKGLVGARSEKQPYDVTFYASIPYSVCAYRSQGYYWNLFGRPQLMENSDVSTNGWVTSDGESVAEQLLNRMVLIASEPSHAETDEMNEMIEGENTGKVLKSQTYNIDFTICNKNLVQTGDGVRISLGFPEGYGPEDEGVTFKVYHFMKNDAGEITGVEELPCVVTKYGLVILCKSFSPFAIVAVEDDGTQTAAEKSVLISSTEGGTVSGASGIATLAEGESIALDITPDEGYCIESVSTGGELVTVSDRNSMKLTLDYDSITGDSLIIDVKFAAESVIEKDKEKDETAVQVDAEAEQPEQPVTPPTGNVEPGGEQTTTTTTTAVTETTKVTTTAAAVTTTEAESVTESPVSTTTARQTTAGSVSTTTTKTKPSAAGSGFCGAQGNEKSMTWKFDPSTGVLTISGKGEMADYWDTNPPWKDLDVTKVVIGNGITGIGDHAFSGLKNLAEVSVPDSLEHFGFNSFVLTKWLTEQFEKDPLLILNGILFDVDDPVEGNVVIPDSVKIIGEDAFRGCSMLTSVTIPESVTAIENYAFVDCLALTSVTIPESVESIGDYAFFGCIALESVTIENPDCDIFKSRDTFSNGDDNGSYFGGTICGYDNSTARDYAEGCEYKFVNLGVKTGIGDIDDNGSIDSSDASLALREYALLATGQKGDLTDEQTRSADVNKDNAVDSSDASTILGYYAFTATGGKEAFANFISR